MKKLLKVFLILSALLTMTACNISETDINERLSAPSNQLPPIEGKWVIKEHIDLDQKPGEDGEERFIGREAMFHREAVILASNYTKEPSYKIKNVYTRDYFIYKYKLRSSTLDIENEKVQVITVLDDNQYFAEFVKVSEEDLLVYLNNSFYRMEKVSEQVSLNEINRYIEIEKAVVREFDSYEDENLETGALLGIKIPSYDNKNQLPMWEYETIWFRSKGGTFLDAYKMKDLLVPRKDGFWLIQVDREEKDRIIKDEINAIPQYGKKTVDKLELDPSRFKNYRDSKLPKVLKNILFVGNNYISVENIDASKDNRKSLAVYPIDNIKREKSVKLSDFIGENGEDIYLEGVQSVISPEEELEGNEKNIGLSRKNGYWMFKGRINYNQNNKELYKDFSISAIPPKDLVNYNELVLPWEAVKRKIPEAIDVYSSPNEDFIVVVTHGDLQIFEIANGQILDSKPVKTIDLPKNASIIMAEWATGRYANLWEEEVVRQDGEVIEE